MPQFCCTLYCTVQFCCTILCCCCTYLFIPGGVSKGCLQVLHPHLEDVRLRLVPLVQGLHLPALVDSVLLVLRLSYHAVDERRCRVAVSRGEFLLILCITSLQHYSSSQPASRRTGCHPYRYKATYGKKQKHIYMYTNTTPTTFR